MPELYTGSVNNVLYTKDFTKQKKRNKKKQEKFIAKYIEIRED